MNQVILSGRLTKDPEVTSNQSGSVASYILAVDKGYKVAEGQPTADFIRCVAFGKSAEFAEKYLHKGIKILITGRINTGSYEKDGVRIYTTDVVVNTHEFCESKASSDSSGGSYVPPSSPSSFVQVPDGISDEELPWS